ncbi:TPA: GNAT family N-acetyltransferase [Streptococcus suis]
MHLAPYTHFQLDQVLALYQSVGWTNYLDRADSLEAAYQSSLFVLAAYDQDQVVGLVRVVGDGMTIVFVQDLLVLPQYQGQGIGTQLLKAILDKYADVYQLQLLTDDSEASNGFYQSVGLKAADQVGCRSYLRM